MTNIWKIFYFSWRFQKVVYSFTKIVQEYFRHHIYIKNQQTKSTSKFCSIHFFIWPFKIFFQKLFFCEFSRFWRHFGVKNDQNYIKNVFVDFDSNKLFLLKMNTFLVVFSKKQHRGTPKVTRTQKMDSHYPTGKGDFWSSQSDLGLKI